MLTIPHRILAEGLYYSITVDLYYGIRFDTPVYNRIIALYDSETSYGRQEEDSDLLFRPHLYSDSSARLALN